MKICSLLLSLGLLAAGAGVYAYQDAPPMPTPSAEHKVLHRAIGTWDALVDMHMGEPSKGAMKVDAGPGQFSIITHFTGDMGAMGPFEGRGIDGYDPVKKKYVSVWTDSWSASPLLTEGTWDEKAQTMTQTGEMPDMAGKMVKSKLVTKWTGNDKMDFEIFAPGADGKEASMMKIAYTRKK